MCTNGLLSNTDGVFAPYRKANALDLAILLRLQVVAVRRKRLQAVSNIFGEARAWQARRYLQKC